MALRRNVLVALLAASWLVGLAVAKDRSDSKARIAGKGARVTKGVPIVLDTDIAGDCDDVGTVAMLNALADLGEARILGVVVNTSLPWGPRCADTICTYYGRPDVPVGIARKGLPVKSRYARKVAEAFPNDLKDPKAIPDALAVYRKALKSQPDGSVTIVSVGFLNNLEDLLRADPGLVKKKVKLLCIMGGAYPKGREYNFYKVASATRYVVDNWPGEILFSGFEIGKVVMTGSRLASQTPPANPVRRAYALYTGKEGRSRESWDQTALLAAVRGPGKYWAVVKEGHCHVTPNGSNQWRPSPDKPNHSYLAWRTDLAVPGQIAKIIEDLMVRPPLRRAKAARPATKGKL